MKRLAFTLLVLIFVVALSSVSVAGAQASGGISVTCDNGASFDNGVEIIVRQMRTGFTYTATAVGLNGFDPVLAVLGEDGTGLCEDDVAAASSYSASLPTTGVVPASNLSSQVRFDHTGNEAFGDISLVVGGFNNQSGEFLLILEGMGVTAEDNAGDPFSVIITPNLVASGVPLTTYMIARTNDLDPLIYAVDENLDPISDGAGGTIGCDDAGDASRCFGQSASLTDAFVSTSGGRLGGFQYDAMLQLPLDAGMVGNEITLLMTSYQQSTFGQYVMAFHMGIGDASGLATNGNTASNAQPTTAPSQQQNNNAGSGAAFGVSVTCDNGASFDNGVEIIVNQMRTGFTYTATAIGLNGFDPVLAVLNNDGTGLCTDDDSIAARYSASLPTTGVVPASSLSSQVRFSHTGNEAFGDISLVVGGFNNQPGEFLLILEGMAVTAEDNAGDPFSIFITPNLVASGVPVTAYMISRTNTLDPTIYQIDADYNQMTDTLGNTVYCDDAGNSSLCWGQSASLVNSYISVESGRLGGFEYDAMLQLPLDSSLEGLFINLLMSSYQQSTLGQYVMAFHMGVGDPATGGPAA